MVITKRGKYYHVRFKTTTGWKSASTGKESLPEAKAMAERSGIARLEASSAASILTSVAISHILSGRNITISQAIPEFLQSCLNNALSRQTIDNHDGVLRRWAANQRVGDLSPSLVEPKHVAAFVNSAGAQRAGTRKLWLSSLSSFFGFCVGRGWSLTNPTQAVRVNFSALSHEQKGSEERRALSDTEVSAIIAHLNKTGDTFWEFAVRCGKETGLRLGDLCCLEWKCLSLPMHITVWTEKSNKQMVLPVSMETLSVLERVPPTESKFIFPHERSLSIDPKSRARLSAAFGGILKRIGIHDASFHSLRRSRAQAVYDSADKLGLAQKLAETLTLEQIRAALGHSSAKTSAGYVHL